MIKYVSTLLIFAFTCVMPFLGHCAHANSQVEVPAILSARLTVEVAPASGYRVSVVYEVEGTRSVDTLPLQALQVFGTLIEQVEVLVNGASTAPELSSAQAPLITGSVGVPSAYIGRDTLSVQVQYRVAHDVVDASNDRFDVAIPLLYVNHAPTETADSTFFATIELPTNFLVTDRFPVLIADVSSTDRIKQYEFALQVLPAYVRLKGTTGDDAMWLTVDRAVDLGVIGLSILGGLLVWMRVHWVRREPGVEGST